MNPSFVPSLAIPPSLITAVLVQNEHRPIKISGDASGLVPSSPPVLATHQTATVKRMLAGNGWLHGGINE
jgi:hypothetical protein